MQHHSCQAITGGENSDKFRRHEFILQYIVHKYITYSSRVKNIFRLTLPLSDMQGRSGPEKPRVRRHCNP